MLLICYKGCTHMLQVFYLYVELQVFYLDVAYVCNGFYVFSGVFFKCFRSMFQVFHLSSFLCCKCYIWMFQN
jgi:hypothetical protein